MPSSFLHDRIPHSILFPNQPLFCFPLVSLVVFVLSIFLSLDKTSFQSKPRSVFLGYSRLQGGYRCYSLDTHRYFVSVDITFFENSFMFSINHPPSSDVIYLPLLYPVSNTSPEPLTTPPRPLQVYTRCLRTDIRPPTDSSPPPSSTMPVLPSLADLSIENWMNNSFHLSHGYK